MRGCDNLLFLHTTNKVVSREILCKAYFMLPLESGTKPLAIFETLDHTVSLVLVSDWLQSFATGANMHQQYSITV